MTFLLPRAPTSGPRMRLYCETMPSLLRGCPSKYQVGRPRMPVAPPSIRRKDEVTRRPGAATARTAEALLGHQAAPAESDLVLHIDLAEPDDLAARPHRLDRDAEPGGTAGRFEHDIDAAPAGLRLANRYRALGA